MNVFRECSRTRGPWKEGACTDLLGRYQRGYTASATQRATSFRNQLFPWFEPSSLLHSRLQLSDSFLQAAATSPTHSALPHPLADKRGTQNVVTPLEVSKSSAARLRSSTPSRIVSVIAYCSRRGVRRAGTAQTHARTAPASAVFLRLFFLRRLESSFSRATAGSPYPRQGLRASLSKINVSFHGTGSDWAFPGDDVCC